jgi:hypothetical protein
MYLLVPLYLSLPIHTEDKPHADILDEFVGGKVEQKPRCIDVFFCLDKCAVAV